MMKELHHQLSALLSGKILLIFVNIFLLLQILSSNVNMIPAKSLYENTAQIWQNSGIGFTAKAFL